MRSKKHTPLQEKRPDIGPLCAGIQGLFDYQTPEHRDLSTPPQQNIRILVTRPDHIGDALLTLPMVGEIKRALPRACLTFLLPGESAEVARHCPYIDETLCATFPPLDRPLEQAEWAGEAEKQALPLKGRFDIAIVPRPDDPWCGPLVRSAGIPVRLGYAAPRTRPYLTHTLPPQGRCHVTQLGLRLAHAVIQLLGVQPPTYRREPGPLFVPTVRDETEAEEALGEIACRAGFEPVVLHPGAGWAIKRWPVRKWGRLAGLLARSCGAAPLVVTGPGEEELRGAIIRESGGRAVCLTRPLSLGALAALHRRARLVVGIDSGPLHLAAMLGRPVVGLYGPADPAEFRPFCPPRQYRIVAVNLPCSPCGTLLDPPCGAYTDPACMAGIGVEQVFQAAIDLLEQSRQSRRVNAPHLTEQAPL